MKKSLCIILSLFIILPFFLTACNEGSYVAVEEVVWAKEEFEVMLGEVMTLDYKIYPNNASNKNLSLMKNDDNGNLVINPDNLDIQNIEVFPISETQIQISNVGTSKVGTITLSYTVGKEEKQAVCKIKVVDTPTELTLFDEDSYATYLSDNTKVPEYNMSIGQSLQLKVYSVKSSNTLIDGWKAIDGKWYKFEELDLSRFNVIAASSSNSVPKQLSYTFTNKDVSSSVIPLEVTNESKGIIKAVNDGWSLNKLSISFLNSSFTFDSNGVKVLSMQAAKELSYEVKVSNYYNDWTICYYDDLINKNELELEDSGNVKVATVNNGVFEIRFYNNSYAINLSYCTFSVTNIDGNCTTEISTDNDFAYIKITGGEGGYIKVESSICDEQGVAFSLLILVINTTP